MAYIITTYIHIFKFETLKNKTKKRKPQKGAKWAKGAKGTKGTDK